MRQVVAVFMVIINDPALDEYRDWINFHIRMMESMNASKMTLTVGENVEL